MNNKYRGVPFWIIYDEIPEGWKVVPGALNVPKGFKLISNGKSRFGGEYQHGVIRVDHKDADAE